MPLENLFKLIQNLSDRIQTHSVVLRKSEMLTRYVLIDPLLRELGWDTENPDQVRPEFRSGPGLSDYALFNNGKPIIMVEAKKLDTSLQEKLGQAIQYCLTEGTPYFAVTDGRRWELYETHRPVPINEKRIIGVDILDESASHVVFKMLSLWRSNVEMGAISVPQSPVIPIEPVSTQADVKSDNPLDVSTKTPPTKLLSTYNGKSIKSFTLQDKQYSAKDWRELTTTLANILYESHKSTFDSVTSLKGRTRDWISRDQNRIMRDSRPIGESGYFIECHWSANGHVRLCKKLLTHFGYQVSDLTIVVK
jgi:hypothetical protein